MKHYFVSAFTIFIKKSTTFLRCSKNEAQSERIFHFKVLKPIYHFRFTTFNMKANTRRKRERERERKRGSCGGDERQDNHKKNGISIAYELLNMHQIPTRYIFQAREL